MFDSIDYVIGIVVLFIGFIFLYLTYRSRNMDIAPELTDDTTKNDSDFHIDKKKIYRWIGWVAFSMGWLLLVRAIVYEYLQTFHYYG